MLFGSLLVGGTHDGEGGTRGKGGGWFVCFDVLFPRSFSVRVRSREGGSMRRLLGFELQDNSVSTRAVGGPTWLSLHLLIYLPLLILSSPTHHVLSLSRIFNFLSSPSRKLWSLSSSPPSCSFYAFIYKYIWDASYHSAIILCIRHPSLSDSFCVLTSGNVQVPLTAQKRDQGWQKLV